MPKKQLKVDAIKNGTVIDHIAAGKALSVAEIINLNSSDEIMVGINLSSRKTGKKDIIKIENHELTADEVNSIALIAPSATLTIINDYKVTKKIDLELPELINGLIECPNHSCVTNTENIKTRFQTIVNETISVRCVYCEKKYNVDEVNINV